MGQKWTQSSPRPHSGCSLAPQSLFSGPVLPGPGLSKDHFRAEAWGWERSGGGLRSYVSQLVRRPGGSGTRGDWTKSGHWGWQHEEVEAIIFNSTFLFGLISF